jgi:predicted transcriptional regulator
MWFGFATRPGFGHHCITNALQGDPMKTAAIPAVRVSPELREAAEDVLQSGETLSGFVEEAVRRNVEFRQAQKAFIERGLASGKAARESRSHVTAAKVMGKLARRLDNARRGLKTP